MPGQIEICRSEIFRGLKALVKRARRPDFFDQGVWDDFARFIVTGIAPQNLRFCCPVLKDLRGELNEVLFYAGACLTGVADLAEQTMQAMTQLVE